MVLTFSSWHIPQSGNNNLLDTGLTGQATTRESGRHQNRSPQNIDSLHTACAQELSLFSQTVPTYLPACLPLIAILRTLFLRTSQQLVCYCLPPSLCSPIYLPPSPTSLPPHPPSPTPPLHPHPPLLPTLTLPSSSPPLTHPPHHQKCLPQASCWCPSVAYAEESLKLAPSHGVWPDSQLQQGCRDDTQACEVNLHYYRCGHAHIM